MLGILSKNWSIFNKSINDITIVSEPSALLLLGLGAVRQAQDKLIGFR